MTVKYAHSKPIPGQFIKELYAWVATYPDGTEGIIAGGIPDVGFTPLITARRDVANAMETIAQDVAASFPDRITVRLVAFTSTEGTRQ